MKPMVEGMGLAWNNQLRNIKEDSGLAPAMLTISIPSSGGNQAMVCLPLDMIAGWLFTINPKQYKNDWRGELFNPARLAVEVVLKWPFQWRQFHKARSV